jgi:hypothetical protein
MPRFVNHAFLEANLFPLPPDGSLNHRSVRRYRKSAIAELERATPYDVEYANSFRLDNAERRCFALRTAQDIKKLNYYPEPNQISRFHHQTRPKPALGIPKHHQTRLEQQILHLDLYNAFSRQFSTF